VGAEINLDGQTATSTQFGAYQIPDVVVAAADTSRVTTIFASHAINGQTWSGENTVEVLKGEAITRNVQIALSQQSTQGSISGTIRDTQGRPLIGARVFVALANPQNPADFDTLASFQAFTDSNGAYAIRRLPPLNRYVVTASFAGHLNRTATNVAVT